MSQALNIDIVRTDKDLQPPLYAKRDIALVRGEGVYLWDADGTRYLDLVSNYGVNILGHAHPKVTEAIQRQAATLVSCHQSFSNDVRSAFLQKLLSIAPAGLTHAFLSNSGTEAIEAALKFAYVATGRTKVVAAKRGYHGRTLGALAATADKKYRDPFAGALAEATHVTYGDAEALAEAVDETTAAVVLEPIQGEGGIHPAPPGYLARAPGDRPRGRRACDLRRDPDRLPHRHLVRLPARWSDARPDGPLQGARQRRADRGHADDG